MNYYKLNLNPIIQVYQSSDAYNINDKVLVKTSNGTYQARVVSKNEVGYPDIKLNPFFEGEIIGLVAPKDELVFEQNLEDEKEVLYAIKQKVAELGLEMKLIKATFSLEKRALIIFFSADKMVDFRDLLFYLSNIYHIKLRLENIGDSREAAAVSNGYGICGVKQCCSMGIKNFNEISKSAIKNQNLPTNLLSHLGNCSKLRCCLMFEDKMYQELNNLLPKKGELVIYQNQKYKVVKNNLLLQLVTIEKELNGEIISHEVSNNELKRTNG